MRVGGGRQCCVSSAEFGQFGRPSHISSESTHARVMFWKPSAAAPDAESAAPHGNFVYVNGHSGFTSAPFIDTVTTPDATVNACRGKANVADLRENAREK